MKILIAIIAYNEEESIGNAILDLVKHNFGYDIVVIDNGSLDETKNIAQNFGIPVVSHFLNSGHSGGTVKTYFNYASYYNYDILVQFDGDAQHIASEIPKIVNLINEGYDYVIGSRFIDNKGFQSTFLRRLGINLFSYIVSIIIGKRITDITSGARAYSRLVIKLFAKRYRNEIIDTAQILLVSHYGGAKIVETPILMQERLNGNSEFNIRGAIGFILKGLINILGVYMQRKSIRKS